MDTISAAQPEAPHTAQALSVVDGTHQPAPSKEQCVTELIEFLATVSR